MRILFPIIVILAAGCSSNEVKTSKTSDTATVYQTDSNIPADTDNYNVPGPSTVPLDAPVDSTPPKKHRKQ